MEPTNRGGWWAGAGSYGTRSCRNVCERRLASGGEVGGGAAQGLRDQTCQTGNAARNFPRWVGGRERTFTTGILLNQFKERSPT